MRVQIRRAKPEDARAIRRVAASADLASIDPNSARVRKLLGESLTLVATSPGGVSGFVAGFYTQDAIGGCRFELDLLAVAPGAQGHGIGSRLATAIVAAAMEGGAQLIRALVRCDNRAMQRLCRRKGFAPSVDAFDLYVGEPQPPKAGSLKHDARLLKVDTLGYAGIWLEGKVSREAIDDARRLASKSDVSLIGAVIPSRARAACALLERNAFRKVGQYHWWVINRQND